MGHYAKIDENNVVTQVIVAKADYIETLSDKDSWIKTSYNTKEGVHYQPKSEQDFGTESSDQSKALRFRYAGPGFLYDKDEDVFLYPKPYPSWVLNKTDYQWYAPITQPTMTSEQLEEGGYYNWYEDEYQADNTKGWKYEVPE